MKSYELPAYFQQHQDRLLDRDFLVEALKPHCRIRRMGWRGSRLRIIQFPEEFASLLCFMVEKRVKSYIEIGVSSGGAFYFADAYLRAVFPDYGRSVGVDLINKIRYLKEYQAVHPQLEFRHMSSKDLRLEAAGERYDMAFVDARHLEKWVLWDFDKVRRVSRYVAFHDIVLQGSGVPAAWAKIKAEHPKRWAEFVDGSAPEEARCGIGLVDLT